ncbi:MAG: hypothetical protein SF162_11150 [bacterium]|nr:hypothetical protein [bacterium]
MINRLLLPILLLMLAACQNAPAGSPPPTVPPFPTVTPGFLLRAPLPPPNVIALDGGLNNPATAIALAARPTPTPNQQACPAPNESAALIESVPVSGRGMELAIETYLSSGGTAVGLERDLRERWNALGGSGTVRGDLDLTGEGTAEIIVALTTPDQGGTLMVFGCLDGRVIALYHEPLGGDAPTLIRYEDMNADARTDLLFASQDCISGTCQYRTQLAGATAERGRLVNLLSRPLESADPVRIEDLDQDRIAEIVVQFGETGSAETGPQRTGFTVYDWDGFTYISALTQLEAPRYLIQVILDGDAAFAAGNYGEAAALYTRALNDASLEAWQPDDRTVLPPYALYRLLLAYAALEDPRRAEVQQAILVQYPDPAAQPVYAALALTFWNAFQITNNLNSACGEVLSIMAARPEAVALLNRYGSASPVYAAQTLCPF